MDQVEKATDALVSAIENSDCYKIYIQSRQHIMQDAELSLKLKIYQNELLKTQTKGDALSFEDEKHMGSLYFELTLFEDFRNFIESEKKLIEMFYNIHERINECCDVMEI